MLVICFLGEGRASAEIKVLVTGNIIGNEVKLCLIFCPVGSNLEITARGNVGPSSIKDFVALIVAGNRLGNRGLEGCIVGVAVNGNICTCNNVELKVVGLNGSIAVYGDLCIGGVKELYICREDTVKSGVECGCGVNLLAVNLCHCGKLTTLGSGVAGPGSNVSGVNSRGKSRDVGAGDGTVGNIVHVCGLTKLSSNRAGVRELNTGVVKVLGLVAVTGRLINLCKHAVNIEVKLLGVEVTYHSNMVPCTVSSDVLVDGDGLCKVLVAAVILSGCGLVSKRNRKVEAGGECTVRCDIKLYNIPIGVCDVGIVLSERDLRVSAIVSGKVGSEHCECIAASGNNGVVKGLSLCTGEAVEHTGVCGESRILDVCVSGAGKSAAALLLHAHGHVGGKLLTSSRVCNNGGNGEYHKHTEKECQNENKRHNFVCLSHFVFSFQEILF